MKLRERESELKSEISRFPSLSTESAERERERKETPETCNALPPPPQKMRDNTSSDTKRSCGGDDLRTVSSGDHALSASETNGRKHSARRQSFSFFQKQQQEKKTIEQLSVRITVLHSVRILFVSAKAYAASTVLVAGISLLFATYLCKGGLGKDACEAAISGFANTTENSTLVSSLYRLPGKHIQLYCVGSAVLGLAGNSVWWAYTQARRMELHDEFSALTLDGVFTTATFLVLAVFVFPFYSLSNITARNTIIITMGIASKLCGSFFHSFMDPAMRLKGGHVLKRVASCVLSAALEAIFVGLVLSLISVYVYAALRFQDGKLKLFILGFLYPSGELILKYTYRNAILGSSRKSAASPKERKREQYGFMYVSRNLEIILGVPNILVIFFIQKRGIFYSALLMNAITEVGGNFISNLRFNKYVEGASGELAKRLSRSGNSKKITPIQDDGEADMPTRMDDRKKRLFLFAFLRNNEEIGELICVMLAPSLIILLSALHVLDVAVSNVGVMVIRGVAAVVFELGVDCVKVFMDHKFGLHHHLVHVKMDVYDAVNLATIAIVAVSVFIGSYSFVMLHD